MSQNPFTIDDLKRCLEDTERSITALQVSAEKYRAAISALEALANVTFPVFGQPPQQPPPPTLPSTPPQQFATPPPLPKLGPPRPEGTPTNFEMAEAVLVLAYEQGKDGLTAAELVEAIGDRYWPGVQGAQILPIMYQYAKTGRLAKGEDGKFHLPQKNEAPQEREPS